MSIKRGLGWATLSISHISSVDQCDWREPMVVAIGNNRNVQGWLFTSPSIMETCSLKSIAGSCLRFARRHALSLGRDFLIAHRVMRRPSMSRWWAHVPHRRSVLQLLANTHSDADTQLTSQMSKKDNAFASTHCPLHQPRGSSAGQDCLSSHIGLGFAVFCESNFSV